MVTFKEIHKNLFEGASKTIGRIHKYFVTAENIYKKQRNYKPKNIYRWWIKDKEKNIDELEEKTKKILTILEDLRDQMDLLKKVPNLKSYQDIIQKIKLAHILQFLYQSEANKRLIKFFDNKLLNFIIFELYFEDKLKEEDLYQGLTKVVNIIIEDINYEEWASFLFKELNKEEIKKKEEIEEENLSKIEKMYEKLNTEEINKKIEILRTFEWIKKIENQ